MNGDTENEELIAAIKKANEELAFILFLMQLNLYPAPQNQEKRQ